MIEFPALIGGGSLEVRLPQGHSLMHPSVPQRAWSHLEELRLDPSLKHDSGPERLSRIGNPSSSEDSPLEWNNHELTFLLYSSVSLKDNANTRSCMYSSSYKKSSAMHCCVSISISLITLYIRGLTHTSSNTSRN